MNMAILLDERRYTRSCRTYQPSVKTGNDFTPDRDNYEYVYLTQSLINLSGKKYRQKKNNLNHFLTILVISG